MFTIASIDDATLAFPASVRHLMPAQADIPDEFRRHSNRWNRLFSDWFFLGLESLELTPKEGVDKAKALRHIRAVMGSFEPKHEHKEAAVAYLLNEWFVDEKHVAKKR